MQRSRGFRPYPGARRLVLVARLFWLRGVIFTLVAKTVSETGGEASGKWVPCLNASLSGGFINHPYSA